SKIIPRRYTSGTPYWLTRHCQKLFRVATTMSSGLMWSSQVDLAHRLTLRGVYTSLHRLFAFAWSMSSIKRDVKKKVLPRPELRFDSRPPAHSASAWRE